MLCKERKRITEERDILKKEAVGYFANQPSKTSRIAENHLARDFQSDETNRKWVSAITFVATGSSATGCQ